MNVHVSGKNMSISPFLTEYSLKNFQHLTHKYALEPLDVAVNFSKSRHKNAFQVDLSVHCKSNVYFRTQGQGETAYFSLDKSLDSLKTKMQKYKKHLHHQKRHAKALSDPLMVVNSSI